MTFSVESWRRLSKCYANRLLQVPMATAQPHAALQAGAVPWVCPKGGGAGCRRRFGLALTVDPYSRKEVFCLKRYLTLALLLVLLLSSAAWAQTYQEAPMLTEKVAAGELPPLEERLPVNPIVEEPWEQIGVYGGTWQHAHTDVDMHEVRFVIGYQPWIGWNKELDDFTPIVAEDWEFNEDGTVFTMYLREGLKWSDGHPHTSADIMFWWEDLLLHEDYIEGPPFWARAGGELMEVEALDDYTVTFTFAEPNWAFPHFLVQGPRSWGYRTPKHALQEFHIDYNPDADRDMEQLEMRKVDPHKYPEIPTLYAWQTVEYVEGERWVGERNPYHFVVDTEGNQLPYIDRIESEYVGDQEVLNLKALAGELSAQFRLFDTLELPTFLQRQEQGDYRVLQWDRGNDATPALMLNYTHKDPAMRELIQNQTFRIALSIAVDREKINEFVWRGLGTPRQATMPGVVWHYRAPGGQEVYEEGGAIHAEFDPERAEELLDEIGVVDATGDGWRDMPDGSQLQLVIDCGATAVRDIETADLAKEDWEAIGIRTIVNPISGAELGLREQESEYTVRTFGIGGIDQYMFPDWYIPVTNTRWAPLYGRYYASGGAEGEEPPEGDVTWRLWELYEKGLQSPDLEDRHQIALDMYRVHIEEGPFFIGTVGQLPLPVVVRNYFHNVPEPEFVGLQPWYGEPGVRKTELFYIDGQ